MKTLTDIVVFSNDETFLVLLRGYCFAKQISVTALDLTMPAIREIGRIKPGLVIIQCSLFSCARNTLEIGALRREVANASQLKIGVITDVPPESVSPEWSSWVDAVFHLPIDLCEIDNYVCQVFSGASELVERRYQERRCHSDRRANQIDHKPLGLGFQSGQLGLKSDGQLGFRLDWCSRCLIVNGKKIELTPKEFELIELLLTDVDRVFMAEEIVKHLWPANHRASKADLYQYMHLLRKKIEDDPNNPKWLMNVKGYGYKLNLC